MNSTSTYFRAPVIENNVMFFKQSEKNVFTARKATTDLSVLPRYISVGTAINNPTVIRDNFAMQPCTENNVDKNEEKDLEPHFIDVSTYQKPGLNFTNLNGVSGIRPGQSLETRREITSTQFLEAELLRRSDSIDKYKEYLTLRRKPNLFR